MQTAISPRQSHSTARIRRVCGLAALVALLSSAPTGLSQTINWGPFRLNVGAVLGATYTDNENTSETDPRSEFSIYTGPTISGDLTLAPRIAGGQPLTVTLSLGYTVSYSFRDDTEDTFNAPIGVAVVLPMYIFGWDVTLSDTFRFSNDPLEKTFASNRDTVPEYNNSAQINVGRRFGRIGLNANATRNDSFLPDDPDEEETTHILSFTPSYFLRETYSVFISGSVSHTDRADELRGEVEGYSIAVGVNGQITQNLSGTASVGYQHSTLVERYRRDTVNPSLLIPIPDDNVDGITSVVALNYSHPLRPNTSYSLSFSRSPGITAALENSDITEATTVALTISHRLTRTITLTPTISWIYLEDVSDVGDGEKTHILQIRTGLSRQFGQRLTGNLTHQFQTRDSNLAGQSYDVNTVTASLSYQF